MVGDGLSRAVPPLPIASREATALRSGDFGVARARLVPPRRRGGNRRFLFYHQPGRPGLPGSPLSVLSQRWSHALQQPLLVSISSEMNCTLPSHIATKTPP